MALTPNDVLNKQFQTTKFRDGYDQDEVDDFLDEVLVEFQRLVAENDQLKSQVAAPQASTPATDTDAMRSSLAEAQAAAQASAAAAAELRSQLQAAQAQLAQVQAQLQETQAQLQTARAQAPTGLDDGMGSAEYLQLARRVHEEHVREGVAKRDKAISEGEAKAAELVSAAQAKAETLVTEAQSTADGLVAAAQSKADGLVTEAQTSADTLAAEARAAAESLRSEAQASADALLAEAQQRRDVEVAALEADLAGLTADRDALQRAVDELQGFEREYRASLKSYLEAQLAALEGAGADTGTVPAADLASAPAAATSPTDVFGLPVAAAAVVEETVVESTQTAPEPVVADEPAGAPSAFEAAFAQAAAEAAAEATRTSDAGDAQTSPFDAVAPETVVPEPIVDSPFDATPAAGSQTFEVPPVAFEQPDVQWPPAPPQAGDAIVDLSAFAPPTFGGEPPVPPAADVDER